MPVVLALSTGVSVFGSSGDGGSHWSFREFPSDTPMGKTLNEVGCQFMFPIFPSPSPYLIRSDSIRRERMMHRSTCRWSPGSALRSLPFDGAKRLDLNRKTAGIQSVVLCIIINLRGSKSCMTFELTLVAVGRRVPRNSHLCSME
jgi:hypothetical protein